MEAFSQKENMKTREFLLTVLLFVGISIVFFYKFFLFGRIPFPGDLLIAEYKPWRTYSYLGYNPGSYPQKAQYFDTIRQLYPWRTVSLREIRQGVIPLWNPYNFSGAPLLANTQSAIFYPLNLVYFLVTQPTAWAILIMLQPLLASIGAYLFAGKIGIGRSGSLLSGITYGYSLFMTAFLEYNTLGHVMVWLPFVLYGVELLLEKLTVKAMLLFVLSITMSALAGHLQLFAYIVIFSYLYFVYRLITRRKRFRYIFVMVLVLPFTLSALQLIPAFELLAYSARAPQEYEFLIEKLLLQPYQLILFLGADLFGNPATYNYLLSDSYPGNAIYVGIIPFLFALSSLILWRKNTLIRIFTTASGLILLLIVRTPLTELLYRLPIPLISTSSPTNMIFLLSFCLSVLAGFGLDAWQSSNNHQWKKILLPVAAVFAILWIFRFANTQSLSFKNLVYSTGFFALSSILLLFASWKKHVKQILTLCLILLTVIDSWYFFQKFNPFVPRELVFPQANVLTWLSDNAGLNRFWGYRSAAIEANIATQYGLYSPEGYDPLYPKWYGEILWSSKNGSILRTFDNTTRSDAVLAQDVPKSKKLLDLLGVRYILDRNENASTQTTFDPHDFRLVYEADGWKIFENLGSLPRAWITGSYQVYISPEEFEQIFFDPSFDPKKTVLLKQKPLLTIDGTPGTAVITSYRSNEITIKTTTPSNQLLILSDTYFPGWIATVDEIRTPILKADWTLRAVSVPKGTHTVIFEYKPLSFSTGLKTSMISVVILGVFCIYLKRQKA